MQMASIEATMTRAPLAMPPKGKAPPLLAPFTKAPTATLALKHVILVFNPVGGKKRAARLAETVVLPMLKDAGCTVTQQPTEHAGHALQIGKTCSLDGVDALLVMGGDGTLSDVLSGLLSRSDGATCALGFVPTGTGNTYMREVLGMKTAGGPEAAVRAAMAAILGGKTRDVDCQQLEMTGMDGQPLTRYSINTAMAGFGPTANQAAEKRRWMGAARYDITIKTELLKLPCRKELPATITVDGTKHELPDLFLFCSFINKHTGTQHRLAPYAQLDDGLLDVCYTNRPLKSIPTAIKIDGLIKGGGKHVTQPLISMTHATSVQLETPTPAAIMVDGDVVGTTPLNVTMRPGAFRLLTPEAPAPS